MDEIREKRRFLAALLPSKAVRIVGAPKTGLTTLANYFKIPEKHALQNSLDYEIFPLTLAELIADKNNALRYPLLDKLLQSQNFENILETIPQHLSDEEKNSKKHAQAYLLNYGGLPGLLHVSPERRFDWLQLYKNTHIKNKLAHLTHTAKLLNYSEMAREADISVDSARRYIDQLQRDYQIILLPPYHRNLTSRVVKTPKLYWLDVGVWRAVSGFYGQADKSLYETFVISEMIKWLRTMKRDINYYFYRTRSGLEIDLLLELPHGIMGVQIQSRTTISPKDITPLKELAKNLQSEWLGGLIVYKGEEIKKMAEPNIWTLPSWRLLT